MYIALVSVFFSREHNSTATDRNNQKNIPTPTLMTCFVKK